MTVDHRGGEVCCCCERTRGLHSFSSLVFDVPLTSDAPGVKESSSEQENGLAPSCSEGRLLSVGCLVDGAAWLDRRGRLHFYFYSFLEAEGLTQLDSRCYL